MAQRDILQNSIDLMKTLRGPAKILYATKTVSFPTMVNNILSATTGAPTGAWRSFGITRGGINVSKNMEAAQRDDADQIIGAFDQDLTDINFVISSQMAEVFDISQLRMAFKLGAQTVLATSAAVDEVEVELDDGNLKMPEYRLAVVYPKAEDGKLMLFCFRRAQLTGGEKVIRFDKSDPASPPLEFRVYPEISTALPAARAYGVMLDLQ